MVITLNINTGMFVLINPVTRSPLQLVKDACKTNVKHVRQTCKTKTPLTSLFSKDDGAWPVNNPTTTQQTDVSLPACQNNHSEHDRVGSRREMSKINNMSVSFVMWTLHQPLSCWNFWHADTPSQIMVLLQCFSPAKPVQLYSVCPS